MLIARRSWREALDCSHCLTDTTFATLDLRLNRGSLTISNEEVDRRIAFIIEQQAQFASDIQQLREVQVQTEHVVARLATVTLEGFKDVNAKINALWILRSGPMRICGIWSPSLIDIFLKAVMVGRTFPVSPLVPRRNPTTCSSGARDSMLLKMFPYGAGWMLIARLR